MSAATSTDWRDAYPKDPHPAAGTRYCYACGETKDADQVHLTPYYGRRVHGVCEDCAMDHADAGAFTTAELTAYLAKCTIISPHQFRQEWPGGWRDFRTVRDRADRRRYSVRVADDGSPRYVLIVPEAEAVASWAEQADTLLRQLAGSGNSLADLARMRAQAARLVAARPPAS